MLPQSDTEAYLWAKKAAESGLAKAQYAIGYFTEVSGALFGAFYRDFPCSRTDRVCSPCLGHIVQIKVEHGQRRQAGNGLYLTESIRIWGFMTSVSVLHRACRDPYPVARPTQNRNN